MTIITSRHKLIIEINNRKYDVEIVEEQKNSLKVRIGSKEYVVHVLEDGIGGSRKSEEGNNYVKANENMSAVQWATASEPHPHKESALRENAIYSEVPGRIVKVLVSEGDVVSKGDTIAIVESMKMEVEIKSPRSGTVKKVFAKNGSYVNVDQPILLLE